MYTPLLRHPGVFKSSALAYSHVHTLSALHVMVINVIGLLCSEVARNKVDNCFYIATLQLRTELKNIPQRPYLVKRRSANWNGSGENDGIRC